jgi:hypothetical protein
MWDPLLEFAYGMTGWKKFVSPGMCHATSRRPAAEASAASAARV